MDAFKEGYHAAEAAKGPVDESPKAMRERIYDIIKDVLDGTYYDKGDRQSLVAQRDLWHKSISEIAPIEKQERLWIGLLECLVRDEIVLRHRAGI